MGWANERSKRSGDERLILSGEWARRRVGCVYENLDTLKEKISAECERKELLRNGTVGIENLQVYNDETRAYYRMNEITGRHFWLCGGFRYLLNS